MCVTDLGLGLGLGKTANQRLIAVLPILSLPSMVGPSDESENVTLRRNLRELIDLHVNSLLVAPTFASFVEVRDVVVRIFTSHPVLDAASHNLVYFSRVLQMLSNSTVILENSTVNAFFALLERWFKQVALRSRVPRAVRWSLSAATRWVRQFLAARHWQLVDLDDIVGDLWRRARSLCVVRESKVCMMSLNVDGASRALASVVKEASSVHIVVLLLKEVNIGKVVPEAIDERVQQCGVWKFRRCSGAASNRRWRSSGVGSRSKCGSPGACGRAKAGEKPESKTINKLNQG